MLRALGPEIVGVETANERRIEVSMARVTERSGACGGVLERLEGPVCLEAL